jgi:general secretion pathway protein D
MNQPRRSTASTPAPFRRLSPLLPAALCAVLLTSTGDAQNDAGRSPRGNLGTTLSRDAVVKYDPETNSIIVITDEDTNDQIATLINKLDQPIPQVLINVLFLEVTYTNDLDYGLEGSFNWNNGRGVAESDFGLAGAAQGGFLRILQDDLTVTMRALAERGRLEVLSRPSVLARNNEEATITIGQEVPFIRNSRVTDNGQTINTVEYEDIGIILSVTPSISPDGLVEMEVSPEISTLTSQTVPITETTNAQVIAKRSASTRVVVQNGKTVVIGGLMEDNFTESIRKLPLLGDIPILGPALFSRTIRAKSKTELLIFLTPTVVTGVEDLDGVTQAERERLRLVDKAFKDVDTDRYIAPLERTVPIDDKSK